MVTPARGLVWWGGPEWDKRWFVSYRWTTPTGSRATTTTGESSTSWSRAARLAHRAAEAHNRAVPATTDTPDCHPELTA